MSETWVLVYATYDTVQGDHGSGLQGVQRNSGPFDHGSGLQEAVEDHGVDLDHLLDGDVGRKDGL